MKKEGLIWLICISFILISMSVNAQVCDLELSTEDPKDCTHCVESDVDANSCPYGYFPDNSGGSYFEYDIVRYSCWDPRDLEGLDCAQYEGQEFFTQKSTPGSIDPFNFKPTGCCGTITILEKACMVICKSCDEEDHIWCPQSRCVPDSNDQCNCPMPTCGECSKKKYPTGWNRKSTIVWMVSEWETQYYCRATCASCNTAVAGCENGECCGRCMPDCRDCTYQELGYATPEDLINGQLARLRKEHIYDSSNVFYPGYSKTNCGAAYDNHHGDTFVSGWLYLVPQRFPETVIEGVFEREDKYLFEPGGDATYPSTFSGKKGLYEYPTGNIGYKVKDLYGLNNDGTFKDPDFGPLIWSGDTEGEWIYWMEVGMQVDKFNLQDLTCADGDVYCRGSDGIAYSKPVFEINYDDNKLACNAYDTGLTSTINPSESIKAFWVDGRVSGFTKQRFVVDLTPQLPWSSGGGCHHPNAVCPWVEKVDDTAPTADDISGIFSDLCGTEDKIYARFRTEMNFDDYLSPNSSFQTNWFEIPCNLGDYYLDWIHVKVANKNDFVLGKDCGDYDCITITEKGVVNYYPDTTHTDYIPEDAEGFYVRLENRYTDDGPPIVRTFKYHPWMFMTWIDDQTNRIPTQALASDVGWCCGDKTKVGFLGNTSEYNDSLDDPDRDIGACHECPIGNHKTSLIQAGPIASRQWDEFGFEWGAIEGDVGRCCGDDTQLHYTANGNTCETQLNGRCCKLPSDGGCWDGYDGIDHSGVIDPDDPGDFDARHCNAKCDRLIPSAPRQVEDCGRLVKCLDQDYDGENYDACAAFCKVEGNEDGRTAQWNWHYTVPAGYAADDPLFQTEGSWGYEMCTDTNWVYGNWQDVDQSAGVLDYDLWMRCSGWGEGYFIDGANRKSYINYDPDVMGSYLCLGNEQDELKICGRKMGQDFTEPSNLGPINYENDAIIYENGGSADFKETYYCTDLGQWSRDLDHYWKTARGVPRVSEVGTSTVCDGAVGSGSWTGSYCCGEADDVEETYNDIVGNAFGLTSCWKGQTLSGIDIPDLNGKDGGTPLTEIISYEGTLHGCAIHEDKALNPNNLDGKEGTESSAELHDSIFVLEKKVSCFEAKKEFASSAEELRCQFGGKDLAKCFDPADMTPTLSCTEDTVSDESTLCYKADDPADFSTYVYCGGGCTDPTLTGAAVDAYCNGDPKEIITNFHFDYFHIDYYDNYWRDPNKHRKDDVGTRGYKDQGYKDNTWLEYVQHNPNPHNAYLPTDHIIDVVKDDGYNGRIINVTELDSTKCVSSTIADGWVGWNDCPEPPSIVNCMDGICEGFNSIINLDRNSWEYCPGQWRVDYETSAALLRRCCPCNATDGCPEDVWNDTCVRSKNHHTVLVDNDVLKTDGAEFLDFTDQKDEVICTNKVCQGENSIVTKIVYDKTKVVPDGPFCCDGKWLINAFGEEIDDEMFILNIAAIPV